MNKLTLKDNTISYCCTFMCGGPCHLSSFKQCSGIILQNYIVPLQSLKYR